MFYGEYLSVYDFVVIVDIFSLSLFFALAPMISVNALRQLNNSN